MVIYKGKRCVHVVVSLELLVSVSFVGWDAPDGQREMQGRTLPSCLHDVG